MSDELTPELVREPVHRDGGGKVGCESMEEMFHALARFAMQREAQLERLREQLQGVQALQVGSEVEADMREPLKPCI